MLIVYITAAAVVTTPLGAMWHNKIEKTIEKESAERQLSNYRREISEEPHPFWGRVKYIPGFGLITAFLRSIANSKGEYDDGY